MALLFCIKDGPLLDQATTHQAQNTIKALPLEVSYAIKQSNQEVISFDPIKRCP